MIWRRGKAYSQDLRSRVLAAADEGVPVGRIATMFRVSVSYVSKVLSRRHDSGEVAARPQRCHLLPKLSALHEAIRAEVAARPDVTLAELRRWLGETHQVRASEGLMHATLLRLGLTLKKSRSAPLSRTGRTSRRPAPSGATASPGLGRGGWCSSTRPG